MKNKSIKFKIQYSHSKFEILNSKFNHNMWNPFKKKNKNGQPQMGMLQKLAMKKLEKMSPEQREKIMREAMAPENAAKNKDKILSAMEQMKASGQITNEQIEMAKKKLGL